MKKVLIFCLTMLTCLFAAEKVEAYTVTFEGTQDYDKAYEILEIVNSERAQEGLKPLAMDQNLLATADLRSAELSLYYNHMRPDGTTCFTAFPNQVGARAENIAVGSPSTMLARQVMNRWMNSKGHHDNIMSSNFQSIGIGYFSQGDGDVYCVQVFSSEPASAVQKSGKVVRTAEVNTSAENVMFTVSAPNAMEAGTTNKIQGYVDNTLWTQQFLKLLDGQMGFEVDNENVISIDAAGNIVAKNAGIANVTIYLLKDSSKRTTVQIPVSGAGSGVIPQTTLVPPTVSAGTTGSAIQNSVAKPQKVTGLKVKSGKKKAVIRWSKQSRAKGYQIQYGKKKSFVGAKSKFVKSTSVTWKGLKSKKNYYFRVRAYNFKENGTKQYGSWSAGKKVKIK